MRLKVKLHERDENIENMNSRVVYASPMTFVCAQPFDDPCLFIDSHEFTCTFTYLQTRRCIHAAYE